MHTTHLHLHWKTDDANASHCCTYIAYLVVNDKSVYVTFIGTPERMDLQEFFEFKWEIVVYIATRYGLEGPGIDSQWERYSPHLSRPAPRPTQPPVQWVPGLFPGVKAAGAWC